MIFRASSALDGLEPGRPRPGAFLTLSNGHLRYYSCLTLNIDSQASPDLTRLCIHPLVADTFTRILMCGCSVRLHSLTLTPSNFPASLTS